MRERLEAMIGRAAEGVWLGTFHAHRRAHSAPPRRGGRAKPSFTILDTDDQLRLLKQIIAGGQYRRAALAGRAAAGASSSAGKTAVSRPTRSRRPMRATSPTAAPSRSTAHYQQRLATVNAVDFGDLLLHDLTLFDRQPRDPRRLSAALPLSAGRRVPGHQCRAVSVAAAAGAAAPQFVLRRRRRPVDLQLARRRDRQHPEIREDFPGALIVRLEENYRSTPQSSRAAAGVIAHNRGRLGKTLWTGAERGRKGRRARVCGTPRRRRAGSATRSRRCSARRHALSEIAILVRAGFQTREFEERFIALALPYRVIGGPRFYERQEIRDALAYLRAGATSRATISPSSAIVNTAAPRHRHRHPATAARRCARREICRWSRRRAHLIASDRVPARARATRWPASSTTLDRWRAECRAHAAHRSRADRARRDRAIPACGRPTDRPTRRAGSKT